MLIALENFVLDLASMSNLHYGLAVGLVMVALLVLKEQLQSAPIALFSAPVLILATLSGMLWLEQSGIGYQLNFSPIESLLSGAFLGTMTGYVIVLGGLRLFRKLR